jgi:hypothetical protein
MLCWASSFPFIRWPCTEHHLLVVSYFQFVMQDKYVLRSPVVAVKDVDSTVHKVDAVHDPMLFEHDGDPNL